MTSFGYRSGASLPHRLDPRFKLLFLVLMSLAGLRAGLWGMLALSAAVLLLLLAARLPPFALLRELRGFLILLAAVFIVRLLATPGDELFGQPFLSVSRQGMVAAALVCGRMLLVVCLGLVFTATSRPAQIRAAVAWILRPVPGVPAARVGTMMSLILRFIPVIFDQARETAEAQRARGVERRKNPVYRLTRLSIPLARRTFESADRLITAMDARCYNESRTGAALAAGKIDWLALAAVVLFCIFIAAV